MKIELLAVMLIFPLTCLADGAREKSAAAIFDDYCLERTSDFASLSARAASEHLQIQLERDIPMPNGTVMRQKNWLIPSFGKAPLMLTSNDGENEGIHVFGCGIYDPEANGAALADALSQLPRMAEPVSRSKLPNGAATVWWRARIGDNPASKDSEVMLSTDIPGISGTGVNLILKRHVKQ
jgi:hypothetical protein